MIGCANGMANENPQLEDGYTKIANELLEAITKFDFGKRHYKVVLFVLRKTYGWNKKADVMSLSQIVSGTGLQRSHACECVNELVLMNVFLKQERKIGQLIELNKKYNQWKLFPKQEHVPKTGLMCSRNGTEIVPKTGTTKENSKYTIKTYIPENFSISERVRIWAEKKGYSNLDGHLENFVFTAKKQNYKYADWDSAFMLAVRGNWAKIQEKPKLQVVI